jgi:hypothetical protein
MPLELPHRDEQQIIEQRAARERNARDVQRANLLTSLDRLNEARARVGYGPVPSGIDPGHSQRHMAAENRRHRLTTRLCCPSRRCSPLPRRC